MPNSNMLIACNGMFRAGSTLQYNLVCSLVEKMGVGERKGYLSYEQLSERKEEIAQWSESPSLIAFKSHAILPNATELVEANWMRICYIYRDIRDVAVSMKRTFKVEGDRLWKLLDKSTAAYFKLKEIDGVIWQKYEEAIADLPVTVKTLALGLDLNPSESLVAEIAAEWSLENARKAIAKLESGIKENNQLDNLLRAEEPVANNKESEQPSSKGELEWQSNIYDPNTQLHIGHISNSGGAVGLWQSSLSAAEIDIATERYSAWLADAGYLR